MSELIKRGKDMIVNGFIADEWNLDLEIVAKYRIISAHRALVEF